MQIYDHRLSFVILNYMEVNLKKKIPSVKCLNDELD